MTALAARDYRRVLDLATTLIDGLTTDNYPFLIAAQLNESLHGTATIFMDRYHLSAGSTAGVAWAPDEIASIPWRERARDFGPHHPLARVFSRHNDTGPLTVSDVTGPLAWRATSTYDSCRQDLDGGIHHLALPLPSPKGVATAFLVYRSGRDFTPRERAMAAQVHPLLLAVNRHAIEAGRLRQRVEAERGPAHPDGERADLGLTPRELMVLALAAEGLTAATIARRMGISPHTVNKHLENAYRKCGTRDRLSTVLLVQGLGLIPRTSASSSP
ncbi:hypothetical protein Asp14428_66840 [Actinoplanes sp. NBRC 14428]|nr:hypothetical protein Asp14428_66840 [Actinoplanes sp. NBRC 14428]